VLRLEAWVSELELAMWHLVDMEAGVVVVVVVVGRNWALVAYKGVGADLGEWDLVGSVEGLSRSAVGIFLLWRCCRCARGRFLVVMRMVVAEAGMCLRVAMVADRTTLWMNC
jgi:hypothetical protein